MMTTEAVMNVMTKAITPTTRHHYKELHSGSRGGGCSFPFFFF
jgi:hypothetical protein